MAVATPVDARVNPNNTAQRYILWGNGRIDAIGGAVPITGQPTWYDWIDQPVVVALHITNWATGAGYVLDLYGGFHPVNGAPMLGTDTNGAGVLAGVPYTLPFRNYVDWAWDPSGNGQGYVLSQYGQLHAFGGATATPRSGDRWNWPAARKFDMQFTPDKRAVTIDAHGGLHPDFAAVLPGDPGNYWLGQDFARDVVVTDWTNGRGYKLDLFGGVQTFGGATQAVGFPYQSGADVARVLKVLSASDPARFWEVWSGGQQFEWVSSTPPSVNAGAGTSEVQRVAITGTPTAGTFTLTYSGQTTAAIAYNATAATVQTALRALSGIGSTGVTVTGGPGPGTAWVVAFGGTLALTDVPQMTATSSLTGGTSPAVTVTTTTAGMTASPRLTTTTTTRPMLSWTYSDPQQDSQAAWQVYAFTQAFVDGHSMTDPSAWASSALVAESGTNRTTRGVTPSVDFANGTYRMYVQVQDTSGQWSAWSNYGWTQNVPLPATPTGLTATANQTTFSVALSVSATTGGSANLLRFECSDDSGVTWLPVRGADAKTLAATTTATDWDPPLGVTRTYRAVAYAVDPAVASLPSSTATAAMPKGTRHVLTAVDDPTLGGAVYVQNLIEWTRPIVAGVFQGVGAKWKTVVKDGGGPKSRQGQLRLVALDAAAWDLIEDLLESGSTLLHRDPLGHAIYFEAVGDWTQARLAAMEHTYGSDLPLIEVRPPQLAA